MVTAAAVQRMRGLPEPVGLGTGRQHMFMASFLPPLPYLSVSLVSSVFPLSLYSSLLLNPTSTFGFECLGITCGRQHRTEIKGHWDPSTPPCLTNTTALSSNRDTDLHTPLCHLFIWHGIREYLVEKLICCACNGTLWFIFNAFPMVGHSHLGPSLPYINTGC